MKLQTKISLVVLPLVAVLIVGLGVIASYNAGKQSHEAFRHYMEGVLQTYISQDLESRHNLLINNHLDELPSFVELFQREAVDALKEVKLTWPGDLKIFKSDGTLVSDSTALNTREIQDDWKEIIKHWAEASQQEMSGHTTRNNNAEFYLAEYFEPWDWYIVVSLDDDHVNHTAKNIIVAMLVVVAVGCSVLLLLISTLSRYLFIKPVQTLKEAANQISSQQYLEQIPIHSRDELGDLARDLETMSQEIKLSHELLLNWKTELEEQVEIRTTELHESEQLLNMAQEIAHVGSWEWNIGNNKIRWSDEIYRILGFQSRTLDESYENFLAIVHPDDLEKVSKTVQRALDEKSPYSLDHRIVMSDGEIKFVHEQTKLEIDSSGSVARMIGIVQDITDQKKSEQEIQQYAETQKTLLQEVNHRVKNNLAAIISLLHREQDRFSGVDNQHSQSLLTDLESRIWSLSVVHNLLSDSNWQPINLSLLCREVIDKTFGAISSTKKIVVQTAPSEIEVNGNQAHHFALIVNELATNVTKYAISNEPAKLDVSFHSENGSDLIVFKDNGPGFPEHILSGDFHENNLGIELIFGMVKKNLKGHVELANNNGACTKIFFQREV